MLAWMKEININLDAISLLTNLHLKAGFSYLILKKKIKDQWSHSTHFYTCPVRDDKQLPWQFLWDTDNWHTQQEKVPQINVTPSPMTNPSELVNENTIH